MCIEELHYMYLIQSLIYGFSLPAALTVVQITHFNALMCHCFYSNSSGTAIKKTRVQ